jgi:hypothetical protein
LLLREYQYSDRRTGRDLVGNTVQNGRRKTMEKRTVLTLIGRTVIIIATVVVLSRAPALPAADSSQSPCKIYETCFGIGVDAWRG